MDVPRDQAAARPQDSKRLRLREKKSRFHYLRNMCAMTWRRSGDVGDSEAAVFGRGGGELPWCPATRRGGPPLVRGFRGRSAASTVFLAYLTVFWEQTPVFDEFFYGNTGLSDRTVQPSPNLTKRSTPCN